MIIWEVYRAIHKEAKRLGMENHPGVIKQLDEEERLVRSMFLVDDYRDDELDDFAKDYIGDITNGLLIGQPKIGDFYVKLTFLSEALGNKILISQRQLSKNDPNNVEHMSNDRIGDFEDTGVLFFIDEISADGFRVAIKLVFDDSNKDVVEI